MTQFKELLQNEPILSRLVISIFTVLAAYGVPISNDQVSSTVELISIIAAIAIMGSARQVVTPVTKAEEKIDQAYNATPGVDKKPTL